LYYHYSHGWNYIVPQSSSVGFEKKLGGTTQTQLFNCDPDLMVWNNSILNFIYNFFKKDANPISFSYKPLGFTGIKYTNVVAFFDVRQNSEKPWIGVSRLLALKENIQNYYLANKGKGNLIRRSGSQLISLDAKTDDYGMDSVIGTGQFDKDGNPITQTHKEKIEDQIRHTGIGNSSAGIIFANLPLKVTSLSEGLDKIDFDKLKVDDARIIQNKYNLPKEFQNLTNESAKFMNRQMAMIEVIQNTIEPLGSSFCEKMKTFFNWENTITLDFSHLPVFSDNEQTKVTTQQAVVTMYEGLLANNRITPELFNQKLEENGII
jgi:hypothetical protein